MINDLKELQKLLKLCRAQGITDFKMNGIEIKFGELPTVQSQSQDFNEETTNNKFENFPDRILTPEELAFYSAGGRPENDPQNKDAV